MSRLHWLAENVVYNQQGLPVWWMWHVRNKSDISHIRILRKDARTAAWINYVIRGDCHL